VAILGTGSGRAAHGRKPVKGTKERHSESRSRQTFNAAQVASQQRHAFVRSRNRFTVHSRAARAQKLKGY